MIYNAGYGVNIIAMMDGRGNCADMYADGEKITIYYNNKIYNKYPDLDAAINAMADLIDTTYEDIHDSIDWDDVFFDVNVRR